MSTDMKLHRLHTEIKISLKIDNPVSRTISCYPGMKDILLSRPSLVLNHISFSLCVDLKRLFIELMLFPHQDVKKCLDALDEISALQVTTQHLQKHSDLISTLKKVKTLQKSLKYMKSGLIDDKKNNIICVIDPPI